MGLTKDKSTNQALGIGIIVVALALLYPMIFVIGTAIIIGYIILTNLPKNTSNNFNTKIKSSFDEGKNEIYKSEHKFCENCGRKNIENSNFCPNCGQKF